MFLSIKDLSAGLYLNGMEQLQNLWDLPFWLFSDLVSLFLDENLRAAVKIGYKQAKRQIDIDGSQEDGGIEEQEAC